ncbi:MAG: DUF3568 family protein [Isosphaeraceae bacterium]
MRRIARGMILAGVVASCGSLSGCVLFERLPYVIDPGETGYSHVLGFVSQRYVYPLPLVERATIEAMGEMHIHSVRRGVTKDGNIVKLTGLFYGGSGILLELEPQNEATAVRVRIDLYGDEPRSRILLERISIRLATLPQSVNSPFDTRSLSDSVLHRGMEIEGYRGAPLR